MPKRLDLGTSSPAVINTSDILSYQLKLIRMRAKLAYLNYCAVPFLSRVVVNLCWYHHKYCTCLQDSIIIKMYPPENLSLPFVDNHFSRRGVTDVQNVIK